MSMVIRNNMGALRTYNLLNSNQSHAQKHMLKVSTGLKLNSAQDDASAYSISERMRVRIRALDQAHQNTQNGSSMIKTAEGAVSNILETLRTLKEKAINSANDSNTDEDRRIIQKEFNQLVDQIDDDALVQFNGMYLIDNSRNNAMITTRSVWINHNLEKDADNTYIFSDLKNRQGESLGIKADDIIRFSYVANAETFHGELKGSDTLGALQGTTSTNGIYSISSRKHLPLVPSVVEVNGVYRVNHRDKSNTSITTTSEGTMLVQYNNDVTEQISGVTIQVLDSKGNINRLATNALKYVEENRFESQTGDRALSFQVGAEANQAIKIALTDMRTVALGLKGTRSNPENIYALTAKNNSGNIISISTKDDANAAIDVIDTVITRVLNEQTNIGAFLSRLEYTAENLTTAYTNDQASESVIRDADMATEMASYVKYNILSQSAQAMLAQANQNPRNVLSLLR